MAIKKSQFFCWANVVHKRLKPSVNQFSYRIFYLCFDIAKIENLASKFLSLNRFNLFSFYFCDHGNRDGSSLEVWIRGILRDKNLDQLVKKIYLMTHPRVLGYVFNPVSFWFCCDENDDLIAVLAEVSNTFGENHNYLIFNSNHAPIEQNQWFVAKKEFHVSPFFNVEGVYKFRFIFPKISKDLLSKNAKNIAVEIDYFGNDGAKNLLTSVVCRRVQLNDFSLLRGFFVIPFMTMKVVFLIHWQAIKIIFKKVKYIKKPAPTAHKITFNDE